MSEINKILVFTATLNEGENIKPLITEIWGHLPNADILVVDDNSSDGTGKILDELSRENSKVSVIHRPRKLGLGSAHKIAMKYAIANNYDALFTMDADFSHNPKYLPQMLLELKNNEFVIGSRYTKGGQCDYGILRVLFSETANHLVRFLLGVKLRETTTSFSKIPLRIATIGGFITGGLSFIAALIYFIYKLIFWNSFSVGIAPLVIGVFFFASLILFFIGIIGEYIGFIYTKVQNRPLVIERERLNFNF